MVTAKDVRELQKTNPRLIFIMRSGHRYETDRIIEVNSGFSVAGATLIDGGSTQDGVAAILAADSIAEVIAVQRARPSMAEELERGFQQVLPDTKKPAT